MNRQINHKTMRVVVGVIALLLTPAVYLLSGTHEPLTSISISYWTDARDVFVGSLIAVGFFLSAYNGSGTGRDFEYVLSRLSCVFAICVALFPTVGFDGSSAGPAWVVRTAGLVGLLPHHIHYAAAVLLFLCLIAMMWFFSNRARQKGKRGRSNLYRAISIAMAVGIVALLVVGSALSWTNTVLLVELWGLTLFGLGWLTAGAYRTDPSLNAP